MRRSAPTSVAIGTTLDVGARVMKNQAPRNQLGLTTNPMTVNTRRNTMNSAYGVTSQGVSGGHSSDSSRGQTV